MNPYFMLRNVIDDDLCSHVTGENQKKKKRDSNKRYTPTVAKVMTAITVGAVDIFADQEILYTVCQDDARD
jgi:hypothetical protein